ncbi:hypothetical protein RHMOL_Rhmol09G0060500 [Rhododendron molle]|uniref:Uncharacterized protein n=1 Tax=Rhododendron molle TaxID=49168 RepID=A0ACC0MBY1_RHOML|nr:hypothetical protein RHMOL_Rhmol09G0060500 [Rhododendron molle]
MKHSATKNVIERNFGVLKMRFAILRSPSYYPIRTQCHIVSACCLLHNLIKREMPNDPIEHEYIAWERAHVNDVPVDDHIAIVESSNKWTAGRDALVAVMYNHWATGAAAEDDEEMTCPDIANESVEPHNTNDFYDILFDNYDQHLPITTTTP